MMTENLMSNALKEKEILAETFGYEFHSTFWEEFCIAEQYGPTAIDEHFHLAFEQWRDNPTMLTELVLVLNWKVARWYEQNDTYGYTYDRLCRKADSYARKHLKGAELEQYIHDTD